MIDGDLACVNGVDLQIGTADLKQRAGPRSG
jgi:hypothetical protein